MRRRLLTILIFLLAGAVVNVAVAWAIVLHLETLDAERISGDAVDLEDPALFKWWSKHLPEGFQGQPMSGFLSTPTFGASYAYAATDWPFGGEEDAPEMVNWVYRLRTGWPARVVEGAFWFNLKEGSVYQGAVARGDPDGANAGMLPIRPLWPGFAVNTIFYAAILWLLIPGPFVLRRLLRRRRGLCPACAYPMGEAAVCTECGRPLPEHSSPPTSITTATPT